MGAGDAKTVLIVDDNAEVRRFVVTVLSSQGYRTIQSASGREALSAAAPDQPKIDVLLTDISLLDTDGITLAERFVALFPGTGVVLMSGYAEVPRSRVEHLGARWTFVAKPFQLRNLTEAVRTVLPDAGARAA